MSVSMDEMNTLVLQQEDLGKRIAQLLSNAKKDAPSRKTETYVASRLSTMEEIWKEVKKNNAKIRMLDTPQHSYFETKYFEQIRKKYLEAKTYLQQCPKASQSSAPEESAEVSEQSVRVKRQMIRIQQLDQTIQTINTELREDKSKIRYEFLITKIQEQWSSIYKLHEEIMVHETEFQSSYFTDSKYYCIEQQYEEAVEALKKKLVAFSHTAETIKPNLKLPKLTIPVFDGNYHNWPTFNDMFLKIIHECTSLTNIEKMQYLKTHIRGEPSRLIQHLQITDANYEAAWELLQKRYQNKRLLIAKLIDKILDQAPISNESSQKLKQLHDTTTECLKAIENLGTDTASWGPFISRIITRRWDTETNRQYEQSLKDPHESQDFQKLMEFLNRRFQSLESISGTQNSPPTFNNFPKASYDTNLCVYCKQPHPIYACPEFKALSIMERNQAVKDKRLCPNCLNHDSREKCRSHVRCRICRGLHHTMLHKNQSSRVTSSSKPNGGASRLSTHITRVAEQTQPPTERQSTSLSSHLGRQDHTVLQTTALINAKSASGSTEYLRALVDPGSQSSFITERAAQLIGRPRQRIKAEITGLGGDQPKKSTTMIQVEIYPRFPSNFSMNVNLLVLTKLTQTMPRAELEAVNPDQWQNRLLADPTYNIPGPIDVILGAEEFGKIILPDICKTDNNLLCQKTELGWMLSGNAKHAAYDNIKVISMISRMEEDKQLTKFWELEVTTERKLSANDITCEDHFLKTAKRNSDGTYTVQIPFKESVVKLGESKSKAAARLLQLEKRLSRDQTLERQYKEFMQEYLALGHMKEMSPTRTDDGKYYIPHQPVVKESSTTTKLRVVFDASSKTSTGTSLNDLMYTGPRLQQELADILLRWRKHKIAFTADIEKMYRQIHIAEEDQMFQRILWRFDTHRQIQEFSLTTVTYGTTAAPYLAIRTLQQLATDEKNKWPSAAAVVMKDFYVDDVLSGADTIEEAVQMQTELTTLLKTGHFTLRKWSSNNSQVLQKLPEEMIDLSALEITGENTKKSLGIHWATTDDTFRFKVETTNQQKITKRSILSQVAKLFDPLGWLAPVTIKAKLLIQELWLQDLDWDQPVPEAAKTKWLAFHNLLKSVETVKIPRWINYNKTDSLELHGFCDSSEKAYGAVIYSRITNLTGETKTSLLVAKSKVAPARARTTIPRLELCASVLLAKLIRRTITALDIEATSIFAWTDSQIALAWIKGDPCRWKTFVANRVAEINKLVPSHCWNHVSSAENPADIISRGIDPTKIKEYSLWWNGPKWILEKNQWPSQNQPDTEEEERRCYHVTIQQNDNPLISRFSSLTRMLRVLSYCKRFIDHARRLPKRIGYLSVNEIEDTLQHLVTLTQNVEMGKEMKFLQESRPVPKNSSILNLNPFLNKNGIMRVGGRLSNAVIPYHQKHPMILPHHSNLSKLIIHDAHHSTLHGGIQITLAYVRRKFWIINGKRAIRSTINKCVKCIRFKAKTAEQIMGDLPAPRVTPNPPFYYAN